MLVSVVIPHFGDPGPTTRLARQLAAQVQVDLEVIIVDDCSPNPLPPIEGTVQLRRSVNGGFGAAVNSGANRASGDLLLILNSDLDIAPTFVAELVSAAAAWQPAVTGPRIVSPDGEASWTARRFPTIGHQVTEWLTPLARLRDHPGWHRRVGHDVRPDPGPAVATDWLVGAVLLLPLAAFQAVGGFDERYHMNSEEVDLQRRLRDRGIPSVYLPSITAVHVGGGSSDPELRRRWVVRSRLRYAEKWGGAIPLKLSLSAATAANLAANCARRLRSPHVEPLRTAREEWSLIWSNRLTPSRGPMQGGVAGRHDGPTP